MIYDSSDSSETFKIGESFMKHLYAGDFAFASNLYYKKNEEIIKFLMQNNPMHAVYAYAVLYSSGDSGRAIADKLKDDYFTSLAVLFDILGGIASETMGRHNAQIITNMEDFDSNSIFNPNSIFNKGSGDDK